MDNNVIEITVIDVVKSISSQHFINKVKILVDYFFNIGFFFIFALKFYKQDVILVNCE